VCCSDRPYSPCSTSILNFSTTSNPGRPPFEGSERRTAPVSAGRNCSKRTVRSSCSSGSPSADRASRLCSKSQKPACPFMSAPLHPQGQANHKSGSHASFRRCPLHREENEAGLLVFKEKIASPKKSRKHRQARVQTHNQ